MHGFFLFIGSEKMSGKRNRAVFIIVFTLLVVIALIAFLLFKSSDDEKVYNESELNIERILSEVDFNQNGNDDYTDILIGARKDAEAMPKYDGSYVAGGYPPDNIGVCTDLVWRAFKEAGYSLKDMLDNDIAAYQSEYPNSDPPDPNIDFRRVKNLKVFFEKYAKSLTCDIERVEEFQAGDIVIFGDDNHIGIVSDKRDKDGHTYVLHNTNQKNREENYLLKHIPTSHYRFDASKIPQNVLCAWE